jgi:hypothetical protein
MDYSVCRIKEWWDFPLSVITLGGWSRHKHRIEIDCVYRLNRERIEREVAQLGKKIERLAPPPRP